MRTLGTNQIENQICEAIELIVNKAVASAGYDKTIRASVVSCIDQSIGKYKVKYQDNIFFAYTENVDVKYSKGTEVYVLVHNNDLNMHKTILGSVKKLGADYITAITPEKRYEKIGTNLITNDNNFELCSFVKEEQRDVTSKLTFLQNAEIKEYISKSSHLVLEMDIKTNLPQSQRYKGNYGIMFDVLFHTSETQTDTIVVKTYKLDINNIIGEPYALNEFTKQFVAFKISPETFVALGNVTIFEYGFPEQKTNQPNDIFIKNISIYGASEVSEQDLLSCYLSVATPQGTYFDEQNALTDKKTMQASVIAKGNVVTDDSAVKYFWFKENAKVSSVDLIKFNKYGGSGWECLNNYNTLVSDEQGDPTAIEWLSGLNAFSITKEDLLTTHAKYKCVAVYGDIILSKEIEFKNTDAIELTIVSDQGTMFFEGVGNPTLTCLINNQQNSKDYTYYWVIIDNNNLLSELQDSDNSLENIEISTITNFATYKCSVYLASNNSYLGTASITLANGDAPEENEYMFILNNGTQVFKYDEDGIAPTSEIMDNPQTIFPLSFTAYDSTGALISSDVICSSGLVKWIVPFEDESLLSIPSAYDEDKTITEEGFVFTGYSELNYEIAKRFNSTKLKNNIKLSIEYNGFRYTTETSFSFLKEGDPGTNGTSYYCRIVPNSISDAKVSYPMIIHNKETGVFTLNYSRPAGQDMQWFKVQLWENDYRVFEDISNEIATEAKPYTIKWSIPKKTYGVDFTDSSELILLDEIAGKWNFFKLNSFTTVNIVKCEVHYNNQIFYATLPVIVSSNANDSYRSVLKENTGFNFVRYSSDGTNPKYNGTNLFKINIFENGVDITNSPDLMYSWITRGATYNFEEETWNIVYNLDTPSYSNQNLERGEVVVRPKEPFNGECMSNAVECRVSKNGTQITSIHIPIHMYLNRYGLSMLNDWDGNFIDINQEGGFILAPQIGAGSKDENNTFTGIVMGEVKESGKGADIGLLGYAKGERSIFLDAATGKAEFGTSAKIIINPEYDGGSPEAKIYSNTYLDENEKSGMLIDFGATPTIKFGSGNFVVNSNGELTAKGGGNIAGWKISDATLQGEDVGLRSTAPLNEDGEKNTSAKAIWAGSKFSVDFLGNLKAVDTYIKGDIEADTGYIGDWIIASDKTLSSADGKIILNSASGITVGNKLSLSLSGGIKADQGTIGKWTIDEYGDLESVNKITSLNGASGEIITKTISVRKGEGINNGYLGTIGQIAGSTGKGDDQVTTNLGIKSEELNGIILQSATHIGIKAEKGVWVTVDNINSGFHVNNVKIDGLAHFG